MKTKNLLFLSLLIAFSTFFVISPAFILITSFFMEPTTHLLLLEKGRTIITICSAALCAFFVGYYYFRKHNDALSKKLCTLVPLFFILEALISAQLYRLIFGAYSYESVHDLFQLNLYGLFLLLPRLITTFFVIKKSLNEGARAAKSNIQ